MKTKKKQHFQLDVKEVSKQKTIDDLLDDSTT